jgi:hypothetical protein
LLFNKWLRSLLLVLPAPRLRLIDKTASCDSKRKRNGELDCTEVNSAPGDLT